MTWANAAVPDAERTARAEDKPTLIGSNALDLPTTMARWCSDAAPTLAMPDESAEDAGAWLAHDRGAARQTYPDTPAEEWWLLFDLGSNAVGSVVFDTLALLNSNLHQVPTLLARLDVSTNTSYTTGLQSLTPSFPITGSRHVRRHLGLTGVPQRYTGFGFGRLRLTADDPFVPQIGELWLGRTRQLRRGPDVPHDPLASDSSRLDPSGDVMGALFTGRRTLRASIEPDDTDDDLRDTDTIRAWYRECRSGTAPFLWIPSPATKPGGVELHRLRRPGLTIPLEGAVSRRVRIEADELPPFDRECCGCEEAA